MSIWQADRAATTTRRLGGELRSRYTSVARESAGRRSASSTNRTTSIAAWATSASQAVTPSRPEAGVASSSARPKVARPMPVRTESASARTRRCGVSCACAMIQATIAPCAKCSRRHWASSEVLPKPAAACTRTMGWSRKAGSPGSNRDRVTRSRGKRGGLTLSNRSSAGPGPPETASAPGGVRSVGRSAIESTDGRMAMHGIVHPPPPLRG